MKKLDINCLATINFEFSWENNQITHKECYLGRKSNLWRDMFPPGMKEKPIGLPVGGEIPYPTNLDKRSSLSCKCSKIIR